MRTIGTLLVSLALLAVGAPDASAAPRVVVLDLHDTIQPASLRYIERGLNVAATERAALVVIELDTPGGLLDSLRSMTSAILASPVPVVRIADESQPHRLPTSPRMRRISGRGDVSARHRRAESSPCLHDRGREPRGRSRLIVWSRALVLRSQAGTRVPA